MFDEDRDKYDDLLARYFERGRELAKAMDERDEARRQAAAYRAERDRAHAEIERMNVSLRKIAEVAETLDP